MMVINWHLFVYLVFILLTCKSRNVYSIQCCLDSACSEKTVDCSMDMCFKLTMKMSNKQSEERGCMKDLMGYLQQKIDGINLNDDNGDSCQKMDTPTGGMSLCKCTSNLCNSSSKNNSYFIFSILFVVYQFVFVFL